MIFQQGEPPLYYTKIKAKFYSITRLGLWKVSFVYSWLDIFLEKHKKIRIKCLQIVTFMYNISKDDPCRE